MPVGGLALSEQAAIAAASTIAAASVAAFEWRSMWVSPCEGGSGAIRAKQLVRPRPLSCNSCNANQFALRRDEVSRCAIHNARCARDKTSGASADRRLGFLGSVSSDGNHVAVFGYTDRNDVYAGSIFMWVGRVAAEGGNDSPYFGHLKIIPL